MKLEFSLNPEYVEFETRLLELHTLIATGDGDSLEADHIRDEMLLCLPRLSSSEEERLDGLSEDLYSLSDLPIEPTILPQDPQWAAALIDARRREDWPAMLRCLRNLKHRLPSYMLAFQRFQAYQHLGHLATAHQFLEFSVQLDPADAKKQHLLWDLQVRMGKHAEAFAAAEKIVQDADSSPEMKISASSIIFSEATKTTHEHAKHLISTIVEILPSALADAQEASPTLKILGHITLGNCHEKLGDLTKCLEQFDLALTYDPQSDIIHISRGLILVKTDLQLAHAAFSAAADLNSKHFHPYYFLASYALSNEDWQQVLLYSTKLSELLIDPEIEAEAKHWQAIAKFEMGQPSTTVASLFQEALHLDPTSDRVFRNYIQVADLSTNASKPRPRWIVPQPSDYPEASSLPLSEILAA